MGDNKDEMIIGEKGTTYGLQLRGNPSVCKASTSRKPIKKNIFEDDDDDSISGDGNDHLGRQEHRMVGKMIMQQAQAAKDDRKVLALQAEALKHDATIFEYDSHVESMREARSKSSVRKINDKIERKSKYITGLLETAEHRKKEQEILKEKRLEKERAAEEHIYGTQETFVTSAYRKKMEEEQKWKMDQERKKKEEENNAVEKKGHMGDFYRNIFKSNVDFVQSENIKDERLHTGEKEERAVTEAEVKMIEPIENLPGMAEERSDNDASEKDDGPDDTTQKHSAQENEASRAERIKREREEKMRQAKQRYLLRKKAKS